MQNLTDLSENISTSFYNYIIIYLYAYHFIYENYHKYLQILYFPMNFQNFIRLIMRNYTDLSENISISFSLF